MDHYDDSKHKDQQRAQQYNNVSTHKGFIHYVFNTDSESKITLINLAQYTFLAFIFIAILTNLMKIYYPSIDDSRSSIEIIVMILIYIFIIFYSIYYIDRIICYIPNYSGMQYIHCGNSLYLFPLVLSVLITLNTMSPQIDNGTRIILERISESWGLPNIEGSNNGSGGSKKKKKMTQSSQQQQQQQQQQPQQQIAPTLYSGQTTSISQLPVVQMNSQSYDGGNSNQQPQQQQQQNQSDYDQSQPMEPMAANEGGAFSSAFGSLW